MITLEQTGGFEEIVLYVLGGLLLVICWGCIYAFFKAIFTLIYSNWDDKEKKSAFSSIRYMILGLFLTVMLLFMAPALLRFMHLQGAERYTAKAVFTYMGKILGHIGRLGNFVKETQVNNQYNGELYYNLDSATPGI